MTRVGRPHGLDGGFYVDGEPPESGEKVRVGDLETVVDHVAGTPTRALIHLRGVDSREAADSLRGKILELDRPLEPGEYLAKDLIGLEVPGVGAVRRVVNAPSCDILEVGDDAVLIPMIRDAILEIDLAAGTIEVDTAFLGIE